ncbi:MAG: glycosyltransferase, partial [Patescibacteria group bacterium]|nr:glycosyltransferase [Patescibacteria group bacterium]
AAGIIANSRGTAEAFRARGFARVLVAPNGVDIAAFDGVPEKSVLRRSLAQDIGISAFATDARIVTYVGHLYPWKGVDTVIGAAAERPEETFLIIGGTDEDRARYADIVRRRGLKNVIILGHVRHELIPHILKASDALLLPNAPISKESERYTSPLKMFEYMASSVPIIASDLPSIRETLSGETATFFKAGDPAALARAIGAAFADPKASAEKAEKARVLVERYSWKGRAEAILQFIGQ